jgi:hypothetical protein
MVEPAMTSSCGRPRPSLSTRKPSGFSSQRGTQQGEPAGKVLVISTPGSRNGRGVPVMTAWKTPFELPRASFSSTKPSVPLIVVIEGIETRIPSKRSSWSIPPVGVRFAIVSTVGAGSVRAVPLSTTVDEVNSVSVRSLPLGVNSTTVPVTVTSLPTAAAAGGAPPVKTKMPSDVAAFAS